MALLQCVPILAACVWSWECRICQVEVGAEASILDLLQVGWGKLCLLQGLADSRYQVRFSFTPYRERIWMMRECWAVRFMAFLLKSVNLLNCIIQFLLTLKQLYSTKITC